MSREIISRYTVAPARKAFIVGNLLSAIIANFNHTSRALRNTYSDLYSRGTASLQHLVQVPRVASFGVVRPVEAGNRRSSYKRAARKKGRKKETRVGTTPLGHGEEKINIEMRSSWVFSAWVMFPWPCTMATCASLLFLSPFLVRAWRSRITLH